MITRGHYTMVERSANGTVAVFLGGRSAEKTRTLGTTLVAAPEAVEHGECRDSGYSKPSTSSFT